MNIVKLARY